MSPLKMFLAAASIAAFSAPVWAETGPDGAGAHAWHKPSPEEMAAWHTQMCKERYAHAAGRMAYLQASLGITDAQRGAFEQWRDTVLSAAKSHSDSCLAHQPIQGQMHDALERNARMEKMLETKLAELKSERPALEALYSSLTPDQKKLFDHEGDHHHGHHHMGERFGMDHDGHGPG
jgi:hypothetical protein